MNRDRLASRTARVGFSTVMLLVAASFATGALLHVGVNLTVGGVRLDEPFIAGAAIVEGVCAAAFAVAAAAVWTRPRWAGNAVRGAHAVGIVAVLFGMATLALGLGPRTRANDLFHIIVLGAMLLTLRFYERRPAAAPSQRDRSATHPADNGSPPSDMMAGDSTRHVPGRDPGTVRREE